MESKPRVLVDLNIVLDVLQRREPFYAASATVLAAAETDAIEGWIAAHSVTTLFYLLAKHRSAERARAAISQLVTVLSVAAVDQAVIDLALALPYADFEDAVQMASAVQAKADYLVTRNPADFRYGPLSVLQPAELLAIV